MPLLADIDAALATEATDFATLQATSAALVTAVTGLAAGTVPQEVLDKVNALDAGIKAIAAAESAATPPAGS